MTTLPRWRKSSRTGQEGNCVELAHTLDRLRDSKDPHGAALAANVGELLAAIRRGRFDR